jgi:hypothetical protein
MSTLADTRIDDLLLSAVLCPHTAKLVVFDGDEAFALEAVEALFYVVVSASREELLGVERPDIGCCGGPRTSRWRRDEVEDRSSSVADSWNAVCLPTERCLA